MIVYCCPKIYHLLLERYIQHENLSKKTLTIYLDPNLFSILHIQINY